MINSLIGSTKLATDIHLIDHSFIHPEAEACLLRDHKTINIKQ